MAKQNVYVDASVKSSGKAGYGIHDSANSNRNASGALKGTPSSTRAELMAVQKGVNAVKNNPPAAGVKTTIRTDSQYAVGAINNNKASAGDAQLAQQTRETLQSLNDAGHATSVAYAPGHAGNPGQTAADAASRNF